MFDDQPDQNKAGSDKTIGAAGVKTEIMMYL